MSLIEKIAPKPCPNPWCASHDRRNAELFELHKPIPMDHADHPGKWVVACPVCPINGPARDSRDEAIAAWNNRAALTAIMGAGDGVPSEAAWELADKIVLGNQGVENAAALIEPALVAAAAAERARMGWQPIETFPGDHPYGTSDLNHDEPKTRYYEDALVYGPTWEGGWTAPFGCKEDRWTGAPQVAIAYTYTDKGFWTISPSVQDWEEYIKPTHWMPLPAPPADAIERGEV